MLAGILPLLKERGLRVALIKHDGHDFEPDVPGTDSYKLRKAGADAVAVYSDRRFMITEERPRVLLEDMIVKMHGCDLILLEGAKDSLFPKIEIVRGAVSRAAVCNPSTLLALATDTDLNIDGVPSLATDDYEALAGIIADYLQNNIINTAPVSGGKGVRVRK